MPTTHRRPLTGARIETGPAHRVSGFAPVAPSQGRGLKQSRSLPDGTAEPVAPSQGRGLKPESIRHIHAPFCGRPLTGARIETAHSFCTPENCLVAPSQGRGLKQVIPCRASSAFGRPLTGARIETANGGWVCGRWHVAPSQGRGLKRPRVADRQIVGGRPLTGPLFETGMAVL